VSVHRSADIAELPVVDTGDELVGERMMGPSASDELVEFDRTGRRDRRRPISSSACALVALAMNRYPVRAAVSMHDGERFHRRWIHTTSSCGRVQSTG
jgi:hypothetical protein